MQRASGKVFKDDVNGFPSISVTCFVLCSMWTSLAWVACLHPGNKCRLITKEKGIDKCRLVVLERYIAWSILEYNSVSAHRMCSREYKLCKKMSESVQSCIVWRKHVPGQHRLYCIARDRNHTWALINLIGLEYICSCDVGATWVLCAHQSPVNVSMKKGTTLHISLPFSVLLFRLAWMRYLASGTASERQCRSPGFDPSILRHSRIWRAVDEAVLNKVQKNIILGAAFPSMFEMGGARGGGGGGTQ